jgi:hypothetical protein
MVTPDVATQPFLQLRDVVLPPPLPLLISLLLVLGLLHLSWRGARWLMRDNLRPVDHAAAFVCTIGLVAALLHALAWAGYASIPLLRSVGWGLIALAPIELWRWRGVSPTRLIQGHLQGASWSERLGFSVSLIITVALFGAGFGPATDADSLEYHLGVPLDWLRHGGAYARPDWFHARLAGLGEAINMLGLAMGSDNLGAVFQASGLVVAMIGVTAFATTRSERLFGILCVAACPVILTLTTAQKWQMLPAAGLTVGLVLLVARGWQFDPRTALLVFGCAAFAAGSKYSFLLSAGVVGLLGLYVAHRAGRMRPALFILVACGTFFAAPVFARNLVFYGDPLSPLLEGWKPAGDPAVIAFAKHLRQCGWEVSWQTLLLLPWHLMVSLTPSTFQDVLGVGVFIFFLFVRRDKDGLRRLVALAALAVFLLDLAFAQLTPRFFFEPYLWCAAVAVPVPFSRLKAIFVRVLTAQGVLVAAVAVYLGLVLFAGALTPGWRDWAMTVMTPGYAEAKWLDAVLPRDALVLENFRYRALMPRRFVAADRYLPASAGGGWSWPAMPIGERYLWGKEPTLEDALVAFIKEQRATVLVTRYPISGSVYQRLVSRYGTPLAGPKQFRMAARSVFNRQKDTGLIVFGLNQAGWSASQPLDGCQITIRNSIDFRGLTAQMELRGDLSHEEPGSARDLAHCVRLRLTALAHREAMAVPRAASLREWNDGIQTADLLSPYEQLRKR